MTLCNYNLPLKNSTLIKILLIDGWEMVFLMTSTTLYAVILITVIVAFLSKLFSTTN